MPHDNIDKLSELSLQLTQRLIYELVQFAARIEEVANTQEAESCVMTVMDMVVGHLIHILAEGHSKIAATMVATHNEHVIEQLNQLGDSYGLLAKTSIQTYEKGTSH